MLTVNPGGGTLEIVEISGGGLSAAVGSTVAFPAGGNIDSTFSGAYTSAGTINFTGGRVSFNGPLTSTGTLNVNGNTVTARAFPINAGTLNIASGATFSTDNHDLTNAATGRIQGAGTLALGTGTLTNLGIVAPGNSPGTLAIGGNFHQGAGGRFAAELGGTGAGQFDVLDVSGTASLGGTLELSLVDNYLGTVGDRFNLIHAGVLTGSFAAIQVPGGYALSPTYLPTIMSVNMDTVGSVLGTTVLGASMNSVVREMSQLGFGGLSFPGFGLPPLQPPAEEEP